ncbi:hypothetical protein B7494_g6489 [Chlorociboria aeruginascens]|nr:hypothetical protein B7494_g6489 [Chlorociboria aeruginascens]
MPEHLKPSTQSHAQTLRDDALRRLSRSPHPYHRQHFELSHGSEKFSASVPLTQSPLRSAKSTDEWQEDVRHAPESYRESTNSDSGTEADDEHFLKGLPAPRQRPHKGLRRSDGTLSNTPSPLISPAIYDDEFQKSLGSLRRSVGSSQALNEEDTRTAVRRYQLKRKTEIRNSAKYLPGHIFTPNTINTDYWRDKWSSHCPLDSCLLASPDVSRIQCKKDFTGNESPWPIESRDSLAIAATTPGTMRDFTLLDNYESSSSRITTAFNCLDQSPTLGLFSASYYPESFTLGCKSAKMEVQAPSKSQSDSGDDDDPKTPLMHQSTLPEFKPLPLDSDIQDRVDSNRGLVYPNQPQHTENAPTHDGVTLNNLDWAAAIRRRHTLPTLTLTPSRSNKRTPSGRRKRSSSSSIQSFLSLTQAQATFRKWLYAGYVYICVAGIILLGIREYVGRFALDGNEPFGWALGYMIGDIPQFRMGVVTANLQRWICLPPRSGLEDDESCHLGRVEHLRHASFGEANTRLILCAYWLAIIIVGLAIVFRLSSIYEVDTRRKVFHFMMVAMLLPATFVDPTFAALALSLMLAIFLLLDLFRASQLPPLSKSLAYFLTPYVDGRDLKGPVVISHIFLLIGCAIPLWLSLGSLPRTGSGYLSGWEVPTREVSMVSGVVCVGMGDAAASLIGRRYGRHKWLWSGGKSIEGSIAFSVAVGLALILAKAWLKLEDQPQNRQISCYVDELILPSISQVSASDNGQHSTNELCSVAFGSVKKHKPPEAFLASLLAVAATAAPAAYQARQTPSPFVMISLHSTSAVHLASINANEEGFYVYRDTQSYCPDQDGVVCPAGTVTAVAGNDTLAMDVEVPGGQQVYIDPSGALKYTIAHSASIPTGAVVDGFIYTPQSSVGTVGNLAHGTDGIFACPVGDGSYQILVQIPGTTFDSTACIGIQIGTSSIDGVTAWEYE